MIRSAVIGASQAAYALHPSTVSRAARAGYRALERALHRHRFGGIYMVRSGLYHQCRTAWCQQQQRFDVARMRWIDDDEGRPGL